MYINVEYINIFEFVDQYIYMNNYLNPFLSFFDVSATTIKFKELRQPTTERTTKTTMTTITASLVEN